MTCYVFGGVSEALPGSVDRLFRRTRFQTGRPPNLNTILRSRRMGRHLNPGQRHRRVPPKKGGSQKLTFHPAAPPLNPVRVSTPVNTDPAYSPLDLPLTGQPQTLFAIIVLFTLRPTLSLSAIHIHGQSMPSPSLSWGQSKCADTHRPGTGQNGVLDLPAIFRFSCDLIITPLPLVPSVIGV